MSSRDDLDRRLDEWLGTWRPSAPPDLLSRATRAAVATDRRRTWRIAPFFAVAAGAATVAAALVIGIAVSGLPRFTGDAGRSPAASASAEASVRPSASVLPSATEQPTPTPTGTLRTWQRHDMPNPEPEAVGGVFASDVTIFNGTYVAIGLVVRTCCGGPPTPDDPVSGSAVWTSPDGVSWSIIESPSFDEGTMQSVATNGARLVAVGGGTTWVSDDAQTWTVVSSVPPIDLIIAHGTDFIGVGSPGDDPEVWQPEVWRSPDGVNWTPVAIGGSLGIGRITDLMTTPDGGVIAVGAEMTEEADGPGDVAAVWISPDGVNWSRVEEQPAFADAYMTTVAYADGAIVSLGVEERGTGSVLAWRSSDGVTWERTGEIFPGAVEVYPDHLTVVDELLIAAGDTHADSGVLQPTLWMSTDGASWEPIPDQQAFSGGYPGGVTAITATTDGTVIAVGHISASTPSAPTSWRSMESPSPGVVIDGEIPGPGAPVPPRRAGIPGISIFDVAEIAEEHGLACTSSSMDQSHPDTYQLLCRYEAGGVTLSVLSSYWATDYVDIVSASGGSPDGSPVNPESSRPLLVAIARLQYEGSDPDAAEEFVNSHYGENACVDPNSPCERTIGAVELRLSTGLYGWRSVTLVYPQ